MGKGFLMTLMLYSSKLSAPLLLGLWHGSLCHLSSNAFFIPSYNRSHLDQWFTIHNLKNLHATPVAPKHCQLSSLGSSFIFFILQRAKSVAWPKTPNFGIPENDHLTSNLSHFQTNKDRRMRFPQIARKFKVVSETVFSF